MQSWGWGELRRQFGWTVNRWIAVNGGADLWVGALQVLHRPLGPGGLRWGYGARGPVLRGRGDVEGAAALLAAARTALRRHRVVALRVDPEWGFTPDETKLRQRLGLREAAFDVQHRQTWIVPLAGDEERILMSLPPSTRRNIRLAVRAGVSVSRGNARDDLECFHRLHLATVSRQGFQPRSLEYYQAVIEKLPATVFIARCEGAAVAAAVVVPAGPRLIYLYGGTVPDPNRASYALHWEVIRWGMRQNCDRYDMWGVPRGFRPQDDHPGYAVFKTRWGGVMETHSGLLRVPMLGLLDPAIAALERAALSRRPLLT